MNNEKKQLREDCRPEDYSWRIRKVANWLGQTEVMIEIDELKGCVSFGDTLKEAKIGLVESLFLWVRKHGGQGLPPKCSGAHLIILEQPMCEDEFIYINEELNKMIKG
ncbi:type II toxin-antitoxin system HicB family antitoxin [bacterium LRH843]|nr:type II toxin-antitoxin system HicB family antitoxin [bacterium LRH843]